MLLPRGCTHKSVDNMSHHVGPCLSRLAGYSSRHICENPHQGGFSFSILLPARLAIAAASTDFNWY